MRTRRGILVYGVPPRHHGIRGLAVVYLAVLCSCRFLRSIHIFRVAAFDVRRYQVLFARGYITGFIDTTAS